MSTVDYSYIFFVCVHINGFSCALITAFLFICFVGCVLMNAFFDVSHMSFFVWVLINAFSYRPKSFVDAGFLPRYPSCVGFVPFTEDWRPVPICTINTWAGVDMRLFPVDGFDTRWIPRSCSFGFIVDIDSVCYLETLEWVIWRHLMSCLETLVWTLKETHPSRHSWLKTTNSMSCLNITNWIELSGDPRTSK